jgi:hypothetical protein
MFMFTRISSGFSAVLPATFTASFAFGAYVLLGTLAALLILNIVICIVGIPIVYKEKLWEVFRLIGILKRCRG